MTNIIVPNTTQQQPAYPQVGATPTPQGVLFTIQLGPTVAITHLISYDDMDNISQLARQAKRELRDMQEMAERAVRGKL